MRPALARLGWPLVALTGAWMAGAACSRGAVDARDREQVVRSSVERSLDYLERRRDNLTVDVLYQLRAIQGTGLFPRADRLADWLYASIGQGEGVRPFLPVVDRPLQRWRTRVLPARDRLPQARGSDRFNESFSDRCLAAALQCQWGPDCRAFELDDGYVSYALTHQVMFYLWALDRGCRLDLVDEDQLDRAVARMWTEQQADGRFSDLFAERAVLGWLAGYSEFVADDVIDVVLQAQLGEGCWPYSSRRPWCHDHATGMATWLLAAGLTRRPGS